MENTKLYNNREFYLVNMNNAFDLKLLLKHYSTNY